MKRIIQLFLTSVISITWLSAGATGTIKINLSTGIDGYSGQYLALGAFDPLWEVQTPQSAPNYVQIRKAGCSSLYSYCHPGYISPYTGGTFFTPSSAPGGNYYYRMKFNFNKDGCGNIQGAELKFSNIGADNVLWQIAVNGTWHWAYINYPTYTSLNIPIAGSELVHGMNEIMIYVENYSGISGSLTGLGVTGHLEITTDLTNPYWLGTTQSSTSQSVFCQGVDQIRTYANYPTNTIGIVKYELFTVNGSSETPVSSILVNTPGGINITHAFQNLPNPVYFQVGVNYRLKMIQENSPCGKIVTVQDFSFECCDESTPVATFAISSNLNSGISASSPVPGNHVWTVYTASNSDGPYTALGTYDGMSFSTEGGGPCYYVTHEVSTACGSSCDAALICNTSCEEGECMLTPPENLQFDSQTNMMTWDPVPGAANYTIHVILNNPACCGDPNGGMSSDDYFTIFSWSNSHTLTAGDLGDRSYMCFSWWVTAHCSNGTIINSEPKCEGTTNGGGSGPNEGFGRQQQGGDPTLGSENGIQDRLTVYPNPVQETVNFELKSDAVSSYIIKVYDRSGKLVKTFEPLNSAGENATMTWDVRALAKGTYFIQAFSKGRKILNSQMIVD